MLLLAILMIGFFAGWAANLVLGGGMWPENWGDTLLAGIAGSFVGGLLFSLIAGHGLALRPSGLIGSFVGAVIVLASVRAYRSRTA